MMGTTMPESFVKEFSHPEMGGALSGVHSTGELKVPVSGPNPALKAKGGTNPTVGYPTNVSREPDFQYSDKYMGPGNKEMQGKPTKDIPLNGFERKSAF